MILADNEFCQGCREELFRRPEVIPEEAIEASLKAELEGAGAGGRKGWIRRADGGWPLGSVCFPSPEDKEWFLPLNLGKQTQCGISVLCQGR